MIFENFKLHAIPTLSEAYCTNQKCKKTRPELIEVSNGFLSRAWFCPKCESVYLLKLERTPKNKISKKFLEQCRQEYNLENVKKNAVSKFRENKEN